MNCRISLKYRHVALTLPYFFLHFTFTVADGVWFVVKQVIITFLRHSLCCDKCHHLELSRLRFPLLLQRKTMHKIAAFVSFLLSSFAVDGANNVPITFHDIVVVEPSGDAVIRLKGYDLDGDKVC